MVYQHVNMPHIIDHEKNMGFLDLDHKHSDIPDSFFGGVLYFKLEFKRFLMENLFCGVSTMLWCLNILLNLLCAHGW